VLGIILISLPLLIMLGVIFSSKNMNVVGAMLGGQIAIVSILLNSIFDYIFGSLSISVHFIVIIAVLLKMSETMAPRWKSVK
jgi:hypothetical protein